MKTRIIRFSDGLNLFITKNQSANFRANSAKRLPCAKAISFSSAVNAGLLSWPETWLAP